jgi:hypothetical protein
MEFGKTVPVLSVGKGILHILVYILSECCQQDARFKKLFPFEA